MDVDPGPWSGIFFEYRTEDPAFRQVWIGCISIVYHTVFAIPGISASQTCPLLPAWHQSGLAFDIPVHLFDIRPIYN